MHEVINAEDRLQLVDAVVQSIGQAVACLELDGTIVMWNAAAEKFFGYAAHEVEGRMCSGLVPRERWDEWGGLMVRVQAGETVHAHETVRVCKDGTRVDVALTLSPVRDADGVVTRVVAAAADITQRKREQEALRQVQKMEVVCRLAGGIAHDFNNMIAVILGQVSLVTQDTLPPRLEKSVRSIKAASEQAQQLVRQLLALSQKQVLDVVEVDVDELVAGIAETARHIVGEAILVDLSLGRGGGVVLADPAALRQVVINLVLNARDAMPSGGTLSISTARGTLSEASARTFAMRPGPAVRLRVRDTGCGLSPEVRAHLFEPFFTTKPVGQGTGLGLATSEGIVLQSKGCIDVSSEEGVGSTFDVWLPLRQP